MDDHTTGDARAPRLNPFLFPSDTDFRFVLLILSVLGAGMAVYQVFFTRLTTMPQLGNSNLVFLKCAVERAKISFSKSNSLLAATSESYSQLLTTGTLTGPDSNSPLYDTSTPYDFCTKTYERLEGFWILGGGVAILLLAFGLYWTEPWRKIRREGLQPLTNDDAPEVVQALDNLCREAGLQRPPEYVWAPLNPASSGLAFGRLGRYHVALTGGLVAEFASNPANFRAVLRHELAHLRNADVDKAYYASAAWQAFIMLALIPLLVWIAQGLWSNYSESVITLPIALVATAGLTALVYLFRNAVLRAREFYADVRASVWDGPDGALTAVVAALPDVPRSLWRGSLIVHPAPESRIQAIEDPGRLMQIDRWSFFGAGIAATIGYAGAERFLSYVLPYGMTYRSDVLAMPIFALILSALLGLMVWMHLFASRMRQEWPVRIGPLSLALTLGLVVGQFLSFETAFLLDITNTTNIGMFASVGNFVVYALIYVVWFLLFWGLIHLMLHWIVEASSAWVEAMRSPSRLWILVVPGLIIFGLVLTYFMSAFLRFQQNSLVMPWAFSSLAFLAYFADGYEQNAALLIPFALAIFPVLAYFWREKGPVFIPGWVYLEPSETTAPFLKHTVLQPRMALWAGLLSGLGYTAFVLLLRVLLKTVLPEATRSTDLYKLIFADGLLTVAGLAQAITGLIVFRRTSQLRGEHALFAALTGGVVMTAGFLGANLLFGGTVDQEFIIEVLNIAIKLGFGSTLLFIIVALGFRRVGALLRRRSGVQLPHASPA